MCIDSMELVPLNSMVGSFCRKGFFELPQGEPLKGERGISVAAPPFFQPRLIAGRGEPRSPFRQKGSTSRRNALTNRAGQLLSMRIASRIAALAKFCSKHYR